MLKKFPTTNTRPQGSKLVTRQRVPRYYWQSSTPATFSALNPFLPPQFGTPATRRNLFTCTLLCTLSVLYRPPSLINFHYLRFPVQLAGWILGKHENRNSRDSLWHCLALEPREVAWKITRFLNRSFPVPPRSNNSFVSTAATLSYMLFHGY